MSVCCKEVITRRWLCVITRRIRSPHSWHTKLLSTCCGVCTELWILVLNCILFAGGHFPHCLILYSMFLFLLPRHWWCYRWSLDHVLCYLSWKMVPLESGVICRDSLLPHSIYANPGLLNLKWSYASLDLIIWLPSAIFIRGPCLALLQG